MITGPLSFSRRHVLGDLYSRCEPLINVPVYLKDAEEKEEIGFADESLGQYADALSFHLAEDVCKKLSSGNFAFSFEYDLVDPSGRPAKPNRIKIISITLNPRQAYKKPPPKESSSKSALVTDPSS
jgi:hypothetical protein